MEKQEENAVYSIDLDIDINVRKSVGTNKFWIHNVEIEKNPTLSPALTQELNERMSPSKDSKPRNKEEVNKKSPKQLSLHKSKDIHELLDLSKESIALSEEYVTGKNNFLEEYCMEKTLETGKNVVNTGLTFEWETSTASHHMTKLFREKNIDYYYNKYGSLVADLYGTGEYLKIDYQHLQNNKFAITYEKNYGRNQNMYEQLTDMKASIVEKATEDIKKGVYEEIWRGRAVSERNPRDYYELRLECDDQKEMVEVKQWIVKDNVAIDLQESAMYISDMKTDCRRAFVESTYQTSKHITNTIEKNFDLKMEQGQNPFKVYLSYEPGELMEHEKALEEMNSISEDIEKTGFKPTEKLVNGIREFSKAEGRNYTLKELAELHHNKQDFKDNPTKQKVFEDIVKECQEQELQKTSFMKMQMQMDQMPVQGM